MELADSFAFLNAGFTESDVAEILEDLPYLHQNARWSYSLERTAEMISDSPDLMLEFLRSVNAEALRGAMIPRSIKAKLG